MTGPRRKLPEGVAYKDSPRNNQLVVLKYLAEHGPATGAMISETTGYNRSTLQKIIKQLKDSKEIIGEDVRIRGYAIPHYSVTPADYATKPKAAKPERTYLGGLKPYVIHMGAQNDGPSNNPNAGGQGAIRQRVYVGSSDRT